MFPFFWIIPAAAALFVICNWDEVVDWIKDVFRMVKQKIKGWLEKKLVEWLVKKAVKILAWLIGGELYLEIIADCLLNSGEIFKDSDSKKIDASEVPAWAKAGVTGSKTDVTERYMQELSLTL